MTLSEFIKDREWLIAIPVIGWILAVWAIAEWVDRKRK